MKSYLIDIEDFFQKLDDYLNNPEEMPVLTIGTARNMAKECRMQIVYDLDWNAEENWKMMFAAHKGDRNAL